MTDRPSGGPYAQVEHVERALAATISDRRFVPHLVLHETEAWVFAAADQLGQIRADPKLTELLKQTVEAAGGPELINDDPSTAPSKRLERLYRERCRTRYVKTIDGPAAIKELGLEELRVACPHLDSWLKSMAVDPA